MKIELRKIVEANQALTRIFAVEGLPAIAAFRTAKAGDELTKHIRAYEKARVKLVRELGEPIPDDDGKPTSQKQVPDDKMEEFTERLDKLLSESISVNIKKIKLPPDLKGLRPLDLMQAIDFVEVEEPVEKDEGEDKGGGKK